MTNTVSSNKYAQLKPLDNDDAPQPARNKKATSQKELVDLAIELVLEDIGLIRDKSNTPYAIVPQGNGIEAIPVRDPAFSSWVGRNFRKATEKRLSQAAIKEVTSAIVDEALDPATPVYPVHHRIAKGEHGEICIDLGTENRDVIAIDGDAIRSITNMEDLPFFQRNPRMRPLPFPDEPNLECLRQFLNLPDKESWYLVVVFILYSLRPNGPYVLLLINGVAGSAKSTFCKILRKLIDPCIPELQSAPRNEHDLVITASSTHLIVVDNLRKISPDLSDSFCRLLTGGGVRMRELYSNTGEVVFDVMRPVIFNGIDDVADQPDLLDRSIRIELPAISAMKREQEADFWPDFEKCYPKIVSGLWEALGKANAMERTNYASPGRMTDFYNFGCAVETVLGWPEESFTDAYRNNLQSLMAETTADDALVSAIQKLLDLKMNQSSKGASGTPQQFLENLERFAPPHIISNPNEWPQTPHALGKRLRKLLPALRGLGIEIAFYRESGDRKIGICRLN